MFKRAQLTRFCILISSFLLASCAFQGDGAYKKDTSWLIFMPATYHHVKFDSFDMSEESQEYEFKNLCSSNAGFQLQIYWNSKELRYWPDEKAELEVSLVNADGDFVYQTNFVANEGKYIGSSGVGDTLRSYSEAKEGKKTSDILLGSYHKHTLGCDEYRIKITNLSPYRKNSVTGRLYLESTWK